MHKHEIDFSILINDKFFFLRDQIIQILDIIYTVAPMVNNLFLRIITQSMQLLTHMHARNKMFDILGLFLGLWADQCDFP